MAKIINSIFGSALESNLTQDQIDDIAAVDGKLTREVDLTTTAANAFTAGKVGFLAAAGTVTLASNAAAGTIEGLLVMATETISGGTEGTFVYCGPVTVTSHGLTVGSPIWVTTAGAVDDAEPEDPALARRVGYVFDANTLFFEPEGFWYVAETV